MRYGKYHIGKHLLLTLILTLNPEKLRSFSANQTQSTINAFINMYPVCHPFSPDWMGCSPDEQERSHETDYSVSRAKILLFSELCKSDGDKKRFTAFFCGTPQVYAVPIHG